MTWPFNCHRSYFQRNLSKTLLWGNVANFATDLYKKEEEKEDV